MKTKAQLLAQLDRLLEALNAPLNAQAVSDGWTPQTQQAFQALVKQLHDTLEADLVLPDVNLSRGLDFAGVSGGQLAEQAAKISNDLYDYTVARRAATP